MSVPPPTPLRPLALATALALAAAALPATAAEQEWKWTAGSGLAPSWQLAGNWDDDAGGGAMPVPGDIATVANGSTAVLDHSYDPGAPLARLVVDGAAAVSQASGFDLRTRNTVIGVSSQGTYEQTGGLHQVVEDGYFPGDAYGAGNLALSVGPTSAGTYRLGGDGRLEVGVSAYVGFGGGGEFFQDGGSVSIRDDLVLGYGESTSGGYDLASGQLSSRVQVVGGGAGALGLIAQDGGQNDVAVQLLVGAGDGSHGSYVLNAGLLNSGETVVGVGGFGEFEQNGGEHWIATALVIGSSSGGYGQYRLSGGLLSNADTVITRNSYFEQSGGAHYVGVDDLGTRTPGEHALVVGRGTDADTGYGLIGDAVLHTARTVVASGSDGAGVVAGFSHTGTAEHHVHGNLVVGQYADADGEYLLGDEAELTVSGNIFVGDEGAQGLVVLNDEASASALGLYLSSASEGGTVGSGRFMQSGGALAVTSLVNNGDYFFGAGTLSFGTLSGNGTFHGDLVNATRVTPGNSPGTLTVIGDYTQLGSGRLVIELASGAHDLLRVVDGAANLAGILQVNLLGGYLPDIGSVFDIVVADLGVFGTFDTLILPTFADRVLVLDTSDPGRLSLAVDALVTTVPLPPAALYFGSAVLLAGWRGGRRR